MPDQDPNEKTGGEANCLPIATTPTDPGQTPYRHRPDAPLRPHTFRPRVELISKALPRVLITPEAYKHMCLYVEIGQKEVGWLGSVSQTENGDFLIEETFLLEQLVHSTETELAAEDIGKLCMSLIESGEDGLAKANKLRFWGHSHVHMGTSPSGTDERTMVRFGREKNPWYVRGIFNKYGHAEFTLYLFDRDLRIDDAQWSVWDPEAKKVIPTSPAASLEPRAELRASIAAEFAAKVKERTFSFNQNERKLS